MSQRKMFEHQVFKGLERKRNLPLRDNSRAYQTDQGRYYRSQAMMTVRITLSDKFVAFYSSFVGDPAFIGENIMDYLHEVIETSVERKCSTILEDCLVEIENVPPALVSERQAEKECLKDHRLQGLVSQTRRSEHICSKGVVKGKTTMSH